MVRAGALFELISRTATPAELKAAVNEVYGSLMGPQSGDEITALYLTNKSYPEMLKTSNSWWAAQRALGDQAFRCALYHYLVQVASIINDIINDL